MKKKTKKEKLMDSVGENPIPLEVKSDREMWFRHPVQFHTELATETNIPKQQQTIVCYLVFVGRVHRGRNNRTGNSPNGMDGFWSFLGVSV
eukprot:CAMPEP_0113480844 /NCGR_PEP_ID=MMETSP0014_2-20120614/22090_1 /TAXON_ID=2857 /ORGANISM="Nitzschia sp." /LENGTH=90 /DNA_ID=CAMNT_0000374297 /DNA_START=335 /DNA_END=607 /DNA_ORIENTATION=- /assembly_acc=CAM_ASM_000159